MASKIKLKLIQGKTFNQTYRWGAAPFLYIPISAIVQQAPVLITVTDHGLPDGWPVAPVSIKGMTELNAANGGDDFTTDYSRITVEDENTVSINTINAAGFSAYVSGGYLKCLTPVDLDGYKARMTIKTKTGEEIVTFTSDAGDFVINNTDKTIKLSVSAAELASLSTTLFKSAVYEIEMYNDDGEVYRLAYGDATLEKETAT
jgi:hypothetical protein